ncbi:hypothetical protein BGZ74_004472 [Mortierella antarctica]|nr:hypothetical protein BGZ74_004472 [Mortierella antarctica]
MNSRKRPARLGQGSSLDLTTLEIPVNASSTSSTSTTHISTPSNQRFTLHYLEQSHRTRLLQMHQYFESVLGLTIGYYARIALLTAFSTAGDMITTTALFDSWRNQPIASGDTTHSRVRVGKEMYSAVIRGLVGNHFQDTHYNPFRAARDARTSVRNSGTTQVHAALELFYDLLRRGGTPTFETYHSLVVGMSVFKNDMEAAELLLDHMLVTKKRPYVQVLHVMIREYTRRREFRAAERLFDMLKEYRIRPKAVTCNMMLKAVFEMSPLEAQEYMGRKRQEVTAFKRTKVAKLLAYMRHNKVELDQVTYSTLIYGFGHFPRGEGYPDMKRTMAELAQSRIEPNLAVLSSLLFAHLQQGKLTRAEVFLDQMVRLSHQEQQDYSTSKSEDVRQDEFQQKPSPFARMSSQTNRHNYHEQQPSSLERAVLGKGPFHAIMLAQIEHGDVSGMERVLDKMMAAAEDNHKFLLTLTPAEVKRRPVMDLKADEHTAKIMLLGYLTARDFAKAELVQAQINARPEWAHLHQSLPLVLQDAPRPVLLTDQDSVLGELEGELDDDIEIDVTTLSAKLRGLMKSAPSP